MKDLSAVIVNYGNDAHCFRLLSQLGNLESIYLVDNSNTINPQDPQLANARLLQAGSNIGYGAAVNLAAELIETRWLLVLNPDVLLLTDTIDQLMHSAATHPAPVIGPRFYWDADCNFQLPPAQGHIPWLFSDPVRKRFFNFEYADLSGFALERHNRFWGQTSPFSEPVLSGACMLIDLEWFRKHQEPVFDPSYFLYYEDTDLCARLLEYDTAPLCAPAASIVHFWNQSPEPPESKQALMQSSERMFIRKHNVPVKKPLPSPCLEPRLFQSSGQLFEPPVLQVDENARYCDLGIEENLVQFARTRPDNGQFVISHALWQQQQPGAYYMRVSDAQHRPLQYFYWEKR